MSKQVNVSEDSYKKFQAALMLTGEDEEAVLSELIKKYAHSVFGSVMGKKETEKKETSCEEGIKVSAAEQKQDFVNWFRSLTRNGRAYNPVTISGYTGRIENACADPAFASIPCKNLFEITDLAEFREIQTQIKACPGFFEFDAKSHNGFTAALRKYEEFLRFQMSGGVSHSMPMPQQQTSRPTNVHRWTMEEDGICCKRFLEYYVIKQSNMDTIQFLQMLAKEVPNVSEGSLRMKVQNIKYLTVRAGLKDSSTLKWLSQYSAQCEKEFYRALRELNIG